MNSTQHTAKKLVREFSSSKADMELKRSHWRAMILYDYKSGLMQQESIDRLHAAFGDHLLQDLQFLSGSPNFDVTGGHWMTRHEWADL